MDEAKLYTQVNLMVIRDFIKFMDKQRGRLKNDPGQWVLDVGCGPGDLTIKMARAYFPRGTFMTGCDSSENMVNYANKTNSDVDVNFKVMDIESQNIFDTWTKGAFDVIVSNLCFQWVRNQRLGAANMFSLLKDDGRAFINILVKHPFTTTLGMVAKRNDLERYTKGYDHFHTFPNDAAVLKCQLTGLFKFAGFREVEVVNEKNYYYWPSFDAVLFAIRGVDPYRKCIPNDIMDLYTEVIRETLMAHKTLVVQDDGWVRMEYDVCGIYAKK